MRATWSSESIRSVEALIRDGSMGAWDDDRLLERYASGEEGRSERAFAVLVDRHGPRVFRVCRSVAGAHHAAEDAFQATFLVLARKAGRLRVGESLGPWLHGVAVRVASAARASEGRRARREARAARPGDACAEWAPTDDLAAILHQEIGGLSAAHRRVVLLCDGEGRTHDEAARALGLPVGTVKSRLSRARVVLRSRLVRRGVTPCALAAGLFGSASASASVPESLRAAAVRHATIGAGGAVPPAVSTLAQGALTMMLMTKIRAVCAAVAVFLAATTAAVVGQDGPDDPNRAGTPAANPSGTPSPRPETAKVESPRAGEPPTRPHGGEPSEGAASPKVFAGSALRGFPFQGQSPNATSPSSERLAGQRAAVAGDGGRAAIETPSVDEVWDVFLRSRFSDRTMTVELIHEDHDLSKEVIRRHYKCTLTFVENASGTATPHVEVIYLDREYSRRGTGSADGVREASAGGEPRARHGLFDAPRPKSEATRPGDSVQDPRPRGPETKTAAEESPFGSANSSFVQFGQEGPVGAPYTGSMKARSHGDAFNTARPKGFAPADSPASDQERRLAEVEKKLDRILRALEAAPNRGDGSLPR